MCRMLIVEDNLVFRNALKDLLFRRFPRMSIEEAGDGKEALRKIELSIPDLIFMDIKLPGANGLEITRKIRSDHKQVIIIVLTSYDLPEYREAAYRCGANYFFTKGAASGDEIMTVVESVASGVIPSCIQKVS